MPGDRTLLDTNAVIAWLRHDDVLRHHVSRRTPLISLFSAGEMFFGIRKSARPEHNESALQRALVEFEIVVPDLGTARHYGDVFFGLRQKGRPIPINDVWIAALALQHGLPLLTRDAHFSEVEGLEVLAW